MKQMLCERIQIMFRILSAFRRLNSFQIIVLGFAFVILLGAGILMLPVSSADGSWTPFVNALFTSVTSVCVTGLVVCDTGTYWSSFGHAVILLLIQTGGLGVVTISASFTILSGKKIGLSQRSIMAESVAAPQLRGVVRLTGFIVRVTLGIELIGALLMAPVFCRDFGLFRGLWMSLFHSVSAFCNAGIDLLGVRGAYSSLTSYAYDPLINLVIILLIVIGGIGFLTWDDIYRNRHHISRYRMQSKVILSYSLVLIFIPAILFFFLEFQDIPAGKRILVSLFQGLDYIRIPESDHWVVGMRPDDPLAGKEFITKQDLLGKPLILPERTGVQSEIANWFGKDFNKLQIAFTSNLGTNAGVMAFYGLGYPVSVAGAARYWRPDLLVQRKLFPEITSSTVIAWQRNLPNSHAVNKFIEIISSVATHDAGTSLISLNACKA